MDKIQPKKGYGDEFQDHRRPWLRVLMVLELIRAGIRVGGDVLPWDAQGSPPLVFQY